MDTFIRVIAALMIAVILGLTLQKQGKDIALALTVAVSCMVLLAAVDYLKPVVEFIKRLEEIASIDGQWIAVLLKAVGIGLVAQISALICEDSGNAALGKTIQFLSSAVILWIAIPLMNALLDLIQRILGEI